MPRYLFVGSYTPQGMKGIVTGGGSARRALVEKRVLELGGRMETFDFAFGSDDLYSICELPDARSAAAISLAVNASGAGSLRTVVLMTPEDIDAAGHLPTNYEPPGS